MPSYSSSGSVATGTTSVVATCPATVNAGDVLIFQVQTNGSAVGTVSGWTALTSTTANSRRQQVFWKVAAGTEGGTTVTCSGLTAGTTSTGCVDRYVPSSSGLLSVSASTQGTDTSITTSAYTATGGSFTSVANDLAVCCYTVTSTTAVLTGFASPALTRSTNWGTSTNQRNAVQSSGLFMVGVQTAPVTTGTTGTANMAGTGTGSSTVGGIAHFLIIHETVPVAPSTPPLAAYNFDENTGTTAADATGNGNTLTVTSGAWTASGHTNSAITGTVAATFASGTLMEPWPASGGGFTIEAWVHLASSSDVNDNFPFLVKSSGGDQLAGVTGGLSTWGGVYGVSGGTQNLNSFTMPIGWGHIAFVFDPSSGTAYAYLNGAVAASQGGLSVLIDAGSTGNVIYIGYLNNGGGTDTCIVDDFRLYGYALSQANILYDMANPVSSGTTNFNGAVASTLALTATASGVVGLASGATSTVTLTATASGASGVGATSTLTLTATASGVIATSTGAASTLTLAGAAAGSTGVATGATETLTLTATVSGVVGYSTGATSTLTLTGAAVGSRVLTTGATSTLSLTGAANGGGTGAVASTLALTGTASGVVGLSAGATSILILTGSVSSNPTGTVTSTLVLTGVAAGAVAETTGANSTLTLTAAAAGVVGKTSGATSTIVLTGTVSSAPTGTANTTLTLTASAAGSTTTSTGATSPLVLTGTAAGAAGRVSGVTETLTLTASVTGVVGATGTATSTITLTSAAAGASAAPGGAVSTLTLTATVSGQVAKFGTATSVIQLGTVAAGVSSGAYVPVLPIIVTGSTTTTVNVTGSTGIGAGTYPSESTYPGEDIYPGSGMGGVVVTGSTRSLITVS